MAKPAELVTVQLNTLPVYYINRDDDTEKANTLLTWLRQKGFEKITRWPGVEDHRRGMGCALAHNGLLENLTRRKTPFIVLEDDAKPWYWKSTIRVPEDADAYYLGLSQYGLKNNAGYKAIAATKVANDTWRLYNMLAAHAIVYFSRDYVKWLHRATSALIDLETNQDKARAQTLKYWRVYGPEKAYVYQDGKHRLVTKVNMRDANIVEPKALL